MASAAFADVALTSCGPGATLRGRAGVNELVRFMFHGSRILQISVFKVPPLIGRDHTTICSNLLDCVAQRVCQPWLATTGFAGV